MILAITPGDPAGIGPEVVHKTMLQPPIDSSVRVVCFGAPEPFEQLGVRVVRLNAVSEIASLPARSAGVLHFVAPPRPPFRGKAACAGYQSGWSIEAASRAALSGLVDALVTGPISKSRLQAGGYAYPGHTEMLATLCGKTATRRRGHARPVPLAVTMMLANDRLRVSLVTTHLPLSGVSKALSSAKIIQTIDHTVVALREWWGIKKPHVAVCALNPHAGESGLMGDEEIKIITPAIARARRRYAGRATITGPHPADTLFSQSRADAVVCMYHDQGLIPVKLIDFPNTVNVSLGLPIIRTSVDHGVAFDLAGTGRADPSSFSQALALAARLASRKNKDQP